ncbi:MAG: tyrosine--tRNA ligase [Defluviitaleaceae bacterium]|nr:tyrosine--tRNA ligase [Defluviitaleaceae bacterium]
MSNVYDLLTERGYIGQSTHPAEVRDLLGRESVSFYIGFDPTADSLTAGGFIQIMTLMHMQRAGHRPIVLMGAGTVMVGDPSGRSDVRKMMTLEDIAYKKNKIQAQISRFITFENDRAIVVDNADWLLKLNYVNFVRDIGMHFSVNRMLAADCYKSRLEDGLTFFEMNYMIMQAYDFLYLHRNHNCKLQMGGNDQWSNIIAGVDLIRRVDRENDAFGITSVLLEDSTGQKMGKSLKGAIYLDAEMTSPYEFFQYWRSIEDASVEKCLRLLTFLPLDEIHELTSQKGSEINKAKERLSYEITKLVHGEEEADKALQAAKALFGGAAEGGSIPTTEIAGKDFENGMPILDLLERAGLIPSRSEGRRLVQQSGIRINDILIEAIDHKVQLSDFKDNQLMIKKGKKVFHRVKL